MANFKRFTVNIIKMTQALSWSHNEGDGVSNHRRFNRLIRHRSKKTAKLRVTGLWEENQPVAGGFPSQRASNEEKCFHLMTSSWVVLSFVSSHVIQCYNSRDVFIPAIQQDCFTCTTTIAWLLLYQWSNPGWYGYSWPWQTHDDVIKWKHFPRYWPFVRGIHRSPVNSPHKGQWHGALMFSFICVRINGWVNNREVGDLRRYRAHYDVIVMYNNDTGTWRATFL